MSDDIILTHVIKIKEDIAEVKANSSNMNEKLDAVIAKQSEHADKISKHENLISSIKWWLIGSLGAGSTAGAGIASLFKGLPWH